MSDSATAIPELTEYLQRLIDAGNYDAVKQLLKPEQPVDAGVMALRVLLLGGLLRRRRQAAGTVL